MGKKREWYKITDKGDRSADIFIYEQIGVDWWDDSGVSAKTFINDLNGLDVENINLYINSPGGDVFDGNAIYNALKRHKAKIGVVVDGIAASIASIIAMAGDSIEMPENAMMMVHDPSGMVCGTADDMLGMAEALEKVKTGLVAAYRDKSGLEEDVISKLMTDETWLTAEEAVGYGLADTMTGKVNMQASISGRFNYKNIPDFLTIQNRKMEESKMKITMEVMEKDAPELLAQIKAAAREEVTIENFADQVKVKEEAAASAERDRVMAIYKDAHGEEMADKFTAIIKPDATVSDMMAFAQDKAKADILAKMIKDSPESLGAGDGEGESTDNLEGEEKWKAEYGKSADLKAEFKNVESYVAFMKAESEGLAKVFKK